MNCNKCNTDNPSDAKYCAACGSGLDAPIQQEDISAISTVRPLADATLRATPDVQAWDVFISYNKADHQSAIELVAALEEAGVACWIAPRDVQPTINIMVNQGVLARAGWDDAIPFAIETSRAMVIVVSANSMQSDQVKDEINLAKNHGITFFPVRVEDVQLKHSLSYHLARAQWNDCLLGAGPQRFSNAVIAIMGFLERGSTSTSPSNSSDSNAFTSKSQQSSASLRRTEVVERSIPTESLSSPTNASLLDSCNSNPPEKAGSREKFIREMQERSLGRTDLWRGRSPNDRGIKIQIVQRGYYLSVDVVKDKVRVHFWIRIPDGDWQSNQRALKAIEPCRGTLEKEVPGYSITWDEPKAEQKTAFIEFSVPGGYASPEADWPQIQDAVIDAMIPFEAVLRGQLQGVL